MEGLSGASFPCSIATLMPENFDISMPLSGSGHQGDPSTGLPVAYNSSPPLYLPSMEHPPSVDVNAEWMAWMAWMADLERIPTHDSARNTCTERPILHEARGFPQTVISEQSLPPEEPPVDTSLTIDDPLFTGRVENPVLAPNHPGLGDFIWSMCGSLDDLSMETPLGSQNSFPLLGTLLHS